MSLQYITNTHAHIHKHTLYLSNYINDTSDTTLICISQCSQECVQQIPANVSVHLDIQLYPYLSYSPLLVFKSSWSIPDLLLFINSFHHVRYCPHGCHISYVNSRARTFNQNNRSILFKILIINYQNP